MIDPRVPKSLDLHGLEGSALDVFQAHHLLTFGTVYHKHDYYSEAKELVEKELELTWAPIFGNCSPSFSGLTGR